MRKERNFVLAQTGNIVCSLVHGARPESPYGDIYEVLLLLRPVETSTDMYRLVQSKVVDSHRSSWSSVLEPMRGKDNAVTVTLC